MRLERVTYDAALYVARNMRPADRAEIFATRWNDSAEDVAKDCTVFERFCWVAYDGDTPCAVIGAVPMHPGVWSVFMFATNNFKNIGLGLTRFVKKVIVPALTATGAHRAECAALAEHSEAHRWLEILGARQEGGLLREYGRNGEDFVKFVWRRDHEGH